jgi:type I restriction enzyme S subunit
MTGAKVGKVGILPDYRERVWLNQRVAMITSPKVPNADILVGNFMQSAECYAIIQNLAYGSAQPNISITGLESIQLAWPQKVEVIKTELDEIADWHSQKMINVNENIILTTLRDTLLPKLISGAVRVKDIENQVAQAL